MNKNSRTWLIWLNWPIGVFRLDARSLAVFKDEVARPGETVTAVRSERAFLRALPTATHAVVWEFRKEWFARAPKLRVLATPGAGRELLPQDDELPPGVVRINGAFHGAIMSETVVAFMFAHARGLYAAEAFRQAGDLWPRAALSPFCSRVTGTHAVILGYGKIGHAIGAKLEALGVRVTGIRRRNVARLKEACRTADWLIVALPSDTGTDDIVNAAVLRALPRRAVLINVGRGNAVDEVALARALRTHRIAAACLDVFKREPLGADSPLAVDLPNLHRLPHASAFAPEYLPMFFRELAAADCVKKHFPL
jgi:phosphoglycerate dehydrogenase-like enzyme